MKKIVAFLLALTLCLGLLAGCVKQVSPENSGSLDEAPAESTELSEAKENLADKEAEVSGNEAGTLFDEKVTIHMTDIDDASFPFNPDWYIIDAIERACNIELDVTTIPAADYGTKLSTLIVGGDVPDLTYLPSLGLMFEYGPQGAFINVMDYLDQMPHFKAWLEKNPERAAAFLSADGAMYGFPEQGVEDANRQGWLYRKDVFEELGLEIPTNEEEFYNVLVALKQAYPDSYPLALRNMDGNMTKLTDLSGSWGAFFPYSRNNSFYDYDYRSGEWVFGPVQDEFKELLEFYNKLYEEGLLNPNVLTVDTAGWAEMMTNGTSFITYDFLSRMTSLTNAGKEFNENYHVAYMPPAAMGSKGEAICTYSATGTFAFCVSANCEDLDSVLKYVDWLYSDEARELVSWGEEGVTCERGEDGSLHWTQEIMDKVRNEGYNPRAELGMQNFGLYLLYDFQAGLAYGDEELAEAYTKTATHETPPAPILTYTDEEQAVWDTYMQSMRSYMLGEVSKFLIGSRSFDEWEDYKKEVMAMDPDSALLNIHISAYERLQKALGK